MQELLIQLGLNFASSYIYDAFKYCRSKCLKPTIEDYKQELTSLIQVKDVELIARKIIEFAAKNGEIEISGSKIFADETIIYKSSARGKFELREGSISSTKLTQIRLGVDGRCMGQGNVEIVQSSDGSIKIHT